MKFHFTDKKIETEKNVYDFSHISEPIVEQLVINFGFDEQTATDKFFTSQTFTQLADTSTELYLKDWAEIYKLLLAELRFTP